MFKPLNGEKMEFKTLENSIIEIIFLKGFYVTKSKQPNCFCLVKIANIIFFKIVVSDPNIAETD